MLFWFAFAVLLALTLVVLVRPLLARQSAVEGGTARDIFTAQLDELERDRERGAISDGEAAVARTEIARRILRTRADHDGVRETGGRAWVSALIIAAFVPVLAVGTYVGIGAPKVHDQPLAGRLAPMDPDRLKDMVRVAEARLAEAPDDGEGWDAIAPAYQQLQRFEDAAAAFGRANDLLGPSVRRLSGQGENLALANGGQVTAPAAALFEAALTLDPNAVAPAIFLAIAARQDGRYEEAAARWQDLMRRSDGTEPWLQVAAAEIQRMSSMPVGGAAGALASAPFQGAGTDTPRIGPTIEAARAAAAMPAEQRQEMIEGMVSRLADRLSTEGGSAEEWARLVRAYRVLGRTDDADATLEAARAALPPDAWATVERDGQL